MPITGEQVLQLRQFVDNQPADQGWKLRGNPSNDYSASWWQPITKSFGWTLFLKPESDGTWRAELTRSAAEDEKRRGSFAQCKEWLADRTIETLRAMQASKAIHDFVDGRKGWDIYEPGRFRYGASRQFRFANGEAVILSVTPYRPESARDRYRASVDITFASGPEHTIIEDTLDPIEAWATGWERVLEIPGKLENCDDLLEAKDLLKKYGLKDLVSLAYLLDIEGDAPRIRRALANKFVPTRRGARD